MLWNPEHGHLVLCPQNSDLLSQHLHCDILFEVADSGVVLGLGHVDCVEVNFSFFVLLKEVLINIC